MNDERGRGPYDTPPTTCPYCGDQGCEADFVDIGIGMQQCGPYHCDKCGATEIGPEYSKIEDRLSDEEKRVGWYKADNSHLTCAPTVGGVLVGNHVAARMLYEMGVLDDKTDVLPDLPAGLDTIASFDDSSDIPF